MSPGVCQKIRERCRWVTEQATHVRIDTDRLSAYARSFPVSELGRIDDDPAHFSLSGPEATAAFVISLDAINFGSGWFPVLKKRPGMSGYHTVATAWRQHVGEGTAIRAADLVGITAEDCARIFNQLPTGAAGELMDLFSTALSDLGTFVVDHYDGEFLNLVADANRSVETLIGILDRIPFFHDVSHYQGVEVPLYKRAQITALDLSLAFGGRGAGQFDDLEKLTIFADNLVPHVLRVEGVLSFDDALLARIDAGELIPHGSPEEVEIRASGIHAVELLRAELAAVGHATTSAAIDTVLWRTGGQPRFKAQARHRTRTVAY